MGKRAYRNWGFGLLVGIFALADAHASSPKKGGSPPLIMPNTLLVEAGERLATSPPVSTAPKMARMVANVKHTPRTCSAVAVLVPHRGTRVVTARHCADHRELQVLDE